MAFTDLPWFPVAMFAVTLLVGTIISAILGRRSHTAKALVPQFGVAFLVHTVLVAAWTFLATPPPPHSLGH